MRNAQTLPKRRDTLRQAASPENRRAPMARRLSCAVICLSLLLTLASCEIYLSTAPGTDAPISDSDLLVTFDTVEGFIIALKKDPNQHMGKPVAIKGYMDKETVNGAILTQLEDVYSPVGETKDPDAARLRVVIPDEVVLAVVDDGDYVEISGRVELLDGEICLIDCTCRMLTAREEME